MATLTCHPKNKSDEKERLEKNKRDVHRSDGQKISCGCKKAPVAVLVEYISPETC